jgi:hypothetical protein
MRSTAVPKTHMGLPGASLVPAPLGTHPALHDNGKIFLSVSGRWGGCCTCPAGLPLPHPLPPCPPSPNLFVLVCVWGGVGGVCGRGSVREGSVHPSGNSKFCSFTFYMYLIDINMKITNKARVDYILL